MSVPRESVLPVLSCKKMSVRAGEARVVSCGDGREGRCGGRASLWLLDSNVKKKTRGT